MSIASRINDIGVHLTKDWRSIEALTGEAEVDKNIENIATVLDNLWEEYPKVTGTGESLTLNTKKGKMKVNLLGNTSQYTTTGKNLLPNNATSQTINGITFTVNEDKTIKINGTASARTVFYMADNVNKTISAGTYTLSADKSDGVSSVEVRVEVNGRNQYWNSSISPTTKTISQSGTIKATYIIIENGAQLNNAIYKPQLEAGSSMTSYEPYTNGASPNPSYPQDVHIVSGDNDVVVCGKNLFDKDSQDILENVRIGADGGNNADSGYFISEFIKVTPNTKYTKNTTADAYHRFAFYTDKLTNSFISKSEDNTITTPSNAKYLRICGLITEKGSIQLEQGSTATPYEPYQSQTYPIHLGEYELCKIGNYQDRFFKNIPNTTDYKSDLEDNEWYLEKKIGKVVLDGSENFTYELVSGLDAFQYNVSEMLQTNVGGGLSNYYKNTDGISIIEDGVIRFGWGNKNIYFFNETSRFSSSIANFKIWLESHNLTAYYILASPTYTKITGTLKDELEAVWRANSYKGTTNISQVNNDLPFELDVEGLSA
jgi:hypothetical protein